MRTQLVCLSLLLAGLMMGSGGCLVVAAGAGAAGAVAYAKGDLHAEVQYGIDPVYTATEKAAEDLKLHVITGESGHDALSAKITARDAEDKHVAIRLTTVTQDITKVSIRVGTFGNQTKQRLIYDKIRDNLKAMSPPPAETAAATAPQPPAPADTSPAQALPGTPAAQPAQNPPAPPSSPPPAPAPSGAAASEPTAQSPPTAPPAQ